MEGRRVRQCLTPYTNRIHSDGFVSTSAVGGGVWGGKNDVVFHNAPQPHPLKGIGHLPKQNPRIQPKQNPHSQTVTPTPDPYACGLPTCAGLLPTTHAGRGRCINFRTPHPLALLCFDRPVRPVVFRQDCGSPKPLEADETVTAQNPYRSGRDRDSANPPKRTRPRQPKTPGS